MADQSTTKRRIRVTAESRIKGYTDSLGSETLPFFRVRSAHISGARSCTLVHSLSNFPAACTLVHHFSRSCCAGAFTVAGNCKGKSSGAEVAWGIRAGIAGAQSTAYPVRLRRGAPQIMWFQPFRQGALGCKVGHGL
jgi:hypothetical protein